MKYGLLYYKDTDNIGDDIQTYAQKRFLPSIDYYIDREKIGMFIPKKRECVSVIMNAWYMHNKVAWPPSPYINPLLISMHFTTNSKLNGDYSWLSDLGGQYLKENGPIGCRDENTLKLLKKHGIKGYFSGCMTLTIKPFNNLKKKDYICLVDVDEKIIEKVKKSTKREVKVISHSLNPHEYSKNSIENRMENVEKLLRVYQEAHLVITTRLHAMLPSVALKTPVILIQDEKYEKNRLGTFTKLVSCYSSSKFKKDNISDLLENPKQNNNSYIKIVKELENKCNAFVTAEIRNKSLPKLSDFEEKIKEKNYYYNLYNSCMKQSLSNIKESEFYYNEKEKRDKLIQDYKKEISKLSNLIREKENYINCLLNSKSYKLLLKIKKIVRPFVFERKK